MQIAPGNFKKSLPNVSIKGIKILPSGGMENDETIVVETKILVEAAAPGSALLPHKLFFACATTKDRFLSFRISSAVFQNEIKFPADKPHLMKKFLGASSEAHSFNTQYLINDEEALMVMAKKLTVTMTIEKKNFSGFVGCICVPYLIEVDNVYINGLEPSMQEPVIIGDPVMERVLVDNISPIIGSVYSLSDTVAGYGRAGDYWTGAVHYAPNHGYMVGFQHTHHLPRLTKQLVGNTKIKDLRFIKKANSLQRSWMLRQATNIDSQTLTAKDQTYIVPINKSYFSNFYFSRASNNAAKIFFVFDEQRLLQDQAKYSVVFGNKASLVSTIQINDIIVYRKRVQPGAATHPLTSGNPADPNLDSYPPREYVGSLQDGAVSYLQLENLPKTKRNVFVTDNGLVDIAAGTYAYTIEIIISDNSPAALDLVANQLDAALAAYEGYMNKFNALGRKNFDPETFVRMNSKEIKSNKSWKGLINTYLSAIIFIFGQDAFAPSTMLGWKKNLFAMVSPLSADITDVARVKRLILEFTQNIRSLISLPAVQGSEEKFTVNSSPDQANTRRRRNKYSYEVPTRYERSSRPDLGVEYMRDEDIVLSNGIPLISLPSYKNRVQSEIAKYKPANSTAADLNTYGFFSPYRLITPTNVINTSQTINSTDALDLLQAKLDDSHNPNNFLGSTQGASIQSTCIQNILAASTISVAPLHGTIQSAVVNASQDSPANMSSEYLDTSLEFNTTSNYIIAAASGSAEDPSIQQARELQLQTIFKNKSVSIFIEAAANQFKKPQFTNVQRLEGSMAYRIISSSPAKVLAMNAFQRDINFNSLVRIRYLAGYNKILHLSSLKDLDWQPLTKGVYDRAVAGDHTLLCECVEIGSVTDTQNVFELETYNKLFLLGNKINTSRTTAPNYQEKLKQINGYMKAQDLLVQVNTSTPAALVPAQYIHSGETSTLGIQNNPGKTGPYGGGVAGAPSSGGGMATPPSSGGGGY